MRGLIVREDRVLMVEHRTREGDVVLALPGGRAHIGEDPRDALAREVFEETRLEIEAGDPIAVTHFSWNDGEKGTVSTIFECELLSGTVDVEANPVPEPIVGYAWVDPSEIDELPMRAAIKRVIDEHA